MGDRVFAAERILKKRIRRASLLFLLQMFDLKFLEMSAIVVTNPHA